MYVNLGALVDEDDPVPKTRFLSAFGSVSSTFGSTFVGLGSTFGSIFAVLRSDFGGMGVLDRRVASSRFTAGGSGASGFTGASGGLTSGLAARTADRDRGDLPQGSG